MKDDWQMIIEMKSQVTKLEERMNRYELSVEKDKDELSKRLHLMNGFREAMKDQSSKFPTRNEVLAFITSAMFLTIAIITMTQKWFST